MVSGIKPAPPEPVEINAGSFFHGAEKVCRCRSFECPQSRIFFERKIKELAPHNRFSQNIDGSRRFRVRVGTQAEHTVGLRHDRNLILRFHVVSDVSWLHAPGNFRIPLTSRYRIEVTVEPLIHPGPLPLIRVDDHRKVEVSNLMNHDTNQEPLLRERIGAGTVFLKLCPRPVESYHRVLHTAYKSDIDRLRGWIGVIKRKPAVYLQGMDYHLSRVV